MESALWIAELNLTKWNGPGLVVLLKKSRGFRRVPGPARLYSRLPFVSGTGCPKGASQKGIFERNSALVRQRSRYTSTPIKDAVTHQKRKVSKRMEPCLLSPWNLCKRACLNWKTLQSRTKTWVLTLTMWKQWRSRKRTWTTLLEPLFQKEQRASAKDVVIL